MNDKELISLIKTNNERDTLEYKENFEDAAKIGEYISALGNAALFYSKPNAYMIWGVNNKSREIVGTKFDEHRDYTTKKNQMPLITYLEKFTDPHINIKWEDHLIDGKKVIVLNIDVSSVIKPIKFSGKKYIKVGTSNSSLEEFPEKERVIWKNFESSKFELEFAKTGISYTDLLNFLDVNMYMEKLFKDPTLNINNFSSDQIIDFLIHDKIIVISDSKQKIFNITNLGAYVLAKNMPKDFPNLYKKTLRITKYDGDHKYDKSTFDGKGKLGIVISFSNIIKLIMSKIPHTEDYSNPTRRDVPLFPQLAIRELVANALVHQDFTISGNRPMVEIYNSKIVITNPGTPLIDPYRFLDFQPRSRNDELADLLGKFNIVESRGTGIDKVVHELEINNLPGFKIETQSNQSTVITLDMSKKFDELTTTEKNMTIYWNSCINYVDNKSIDNKTLRSRFKVDSKYNSKISTALKNAQNANLIKPYDPDGGRKFKKYIPFWGMNVLEQNSQKNN